MGAIRDDGIASVEENGVPEIDLAAACLLIEKIGSTFETMKEERDPDVAARRLLRAKFGKHHAFYQTINYPVRSFH